MKIIQRAWWVLLTLTLYLAIQASSPAAAQPQLVRSDRRGVSSTSAACLGIDPLAPAMRQATVDLDWQGIATEARLILTVSGAEAAHTIKINQLPVATAPLYTEGEACGDGEVFYLDIPPTVLVRGANQIEITDDALAGDRWRAAHLRLELLGAVTPAAMGLLGRGGDSVGAPQAATTISFRNAYDDSTQQARVQTPGGYSGAPTPLVVVVHPRSNDMFWGENEGYHTAANNQGWFYASPQLHGHWPGTASAPVPDPPGKYAYASLESQYDVVGTVQYMVEQYNIDPHRIYLYGQSMGAQVAMVTAAKFPDLFAALFLNKGPSDWGQWHEETKALIADGYNQAFHKQWMERECFTMINGLPTPQTPTQNPFCYERRSGVNFAANYLHTPVAMTHSRADLLVPLSHSTRLQAAINSHGPDYPAAVTVDMVVGPTCADGDGGPTPYYHCYANDPGAVLAFFAETVRQERPTHLRIKTDESKAFYWLKIALTGSDHWSQVEASYDAVNAIVTARIVDPSPLVLGFNLGSAPTKDVVMQPGMGLPATTYLVQEQGQPAYLVDYSTGYLTTPLHSTGEVTLTIAAVDLTVTANPSVKTAGQSMMATIMVAAKDRLNHPVPDGSPVLLTTTSGRFPNGASSMTAVTTGGAVSVNLALAATDDAAQVIAAIGNHPARTMGSTTIGVETPPPTAPPAAPPTATPITAQPDQQLFLPLIQR